MNNKRAEHDILLIKFCEQLSFDFNNRYSDCNTFSINIGGRQYTSYFAEWANEFERIRHQLESIVYNSKAQIKFYNDNGIGVLINLEEETLKESQQIVTRVTIYPAERDKPVISGYCDKQQAMRALYQGLLNITRNGVDSEYMRDYDVNWEKHKLVIYNKLKSPLIERYLNGYGCDDRISSIRQQQIRDYYTINADVVAIIWNSWGCAQIVDIDDIFETDDFSIKVEGLYQWHMDLDKAADWANTKVEDGFDWAAWHKRGLELAQNLRQQLPDEYDLWYSAPFEDKSGTLKEDFLIIKQ